jgi:hypothetical protein
VTNYHRLANVTVFSQASAPTRGYHGHRNGGGHLLGNSSFHDFVLNPHGHFIFTGALWFPTAAHLIRYGYNAKKVPREVALTKCMKLTDDGIELNGRFSLTTVKIVDHIAQRCVVENSTVCSIPKFYDRYIRLPRPYRDVVFFSQVKTHLRPEVILQQSNIVCVLHIYYLPIYLYMWVCTMPLFVNLITEVTGSDL